MELLDDSKFLTLSFAMAFILIYFWYTLELVSDGGGGGGEESGV